MVPSEISGSECKAFRKRLKLSQQEFADKLGICRSLVVRGESGTPAPLLGRGVLSLIHQEENENLKLQIKILIEQNQVTARVLKGGEQKLVEEVQRLLKENEELRMAIQVMMTVRKRKP